MGQGKTSARALAAAIKNPNKALRELLDRLEHESPETQAADLAKGKLLLVEMKQHPNYKKPEPDYREDAVEFTSRAIGELISPPQFPGESKELECINIKLALLAYSYELRAIWQLWLASRQQTGERYHTSKSVPPDDGHGSSKLVLAWKTDEMPVACWYDYADELWNLGCNIEKPRNYFNYWAFWPTYQ